MGTKSKGPVRKITEGGAGCVPEPLLLKGRKLESIIAGLGRVAVAYSGGVDSTFLLRVARSVLENDDVLAVNVVAAVNSRAETEEARALAGRLGADLVTVEVDVMSNREFTKNPPDRCYICKKELFRSIMAEAAKKGFKHIVEGMNADDPSDYRPGAKALAELGIRSPLMEAGLTKAEIRELSGLLGLETAQKPSAACLASRFPYGTEITTAGLAAVDAAEMVLREAGFRQVRVRHCGETARIEVERGEAARLFEPGLREKISRSLKKIGYIYISVDLDGYRTGSLNEKLSGAARKS